MAERFTFPRTHRLGGRSAFGAVFAARLRKHAGPLTVHGRANDLPHPRLGLSVSRRVGSAVVRSRVKRMLREAFRLTQRDLPAGYDFVVVVRKHEPAALDDYQRWLAVAAREVDRETRKRRS